MKVWGVKETRIAQAMDDLLITYSTSFQRDGRAVRVTLRPRTSDSLFARRSNSTGRRGPWLCWHGFEHFITIMFNLDATRVQTVHGDWRSLDEFENDLYRLSMVNVGSIMHPAYLGESLCECA